MSDSMDIDDIIDNIQDGRQRLQTSEDETAAHDAKQLKQAWIKERTCPELLSFEDSLLDRIMTRVREQVSLVHKYAFANVH
jgi:hypothetical protein